MRNAQSAYQEEKVKVKTSEILKSRNHVFQLLKIRSREVIYKLKPAFSYAKVKKW